MQDLNLNDLGAPRSVGADGVINVSDEALRRRIDFIGLTEEDLGIIASWRDRFLAGSNAMVDEFYRVVLENPDTRAILEQHSSVERQRPLLTTYVLTFFNGQITDDYIRLREKVGITHERIDLDTTQYVAMYEVLRRILCDTVRSTGVDQDEYNRFSEALSRLFLLDIALCSASLAEARATKITAMQEQMRERMQALTSEIESLIESARSGELSRRIDLADFAGRDEELLHGVNDMLDAILSPIAEATHSLEGMALGDLTSRMQGQYQGDHERIKVALNQAVTNLDSGFMQVATSSQQLTSAAHQISTGSQDLANQTSQQASALQEISASLQEMNSMAQRGSASAGEADSLMRETSDNLTSGMKHMGELNSAMDRIRESSEATARIVKTIDEIAFQTNLLALNAAVEAARAGDAGKGFAVVADEVRNLSIRSAEAAKNTADLIQESSRNVQQGVDTSGEVMESLTEVKTEVEKVAEVLVDVREDAERQKESISGINIALEQINQATQVTAANAEESAASSEEMSSQAQLMNQLVGKYKLSNRDDGGVPRVEQTPAWDPQLV